MDLDLKQSVVTKYNVDSNQNPISINKIEAQQVHSLKNLIQTSGIIDEFKSVQIIDRNMYEVFNLDDIESENQYYVDYAQGVIHFHPNTAGKTIKYEYGNLGVEYISANRIFSKQDAYGNVVEVIQDIIDQGREAIELIKTLGNAVVIIRKLEDSIKEGKQTVTNINNAILSGDNKISEINDAVEQATEDIDNKIAEVESELDKVDNLTGNDIKYITKNQWVLNSDSGLYEYTLPHTMNSKALTINCYYTDTDEFAFIGGKILDKNNILFKNEEAVNLTVVLNSRYYKPQVTLTSEIAEEVVEARKGKVDLKTKIDEIDNGLVKVNEDLETIAYNTSINYKAKYKGMNIWLDNNSTVGDVKLIEHFNYMKELSVNALYLPLYQNVDTSLNIVSAVNDEVIAFCINECKLRDIKPIIKPHLTGRENINDNNREIFISKWKIVIEKYASMSQINNLDEICIVNEQMDNTKVFRSLWAEIIQVAKGKGLKVSVALAGMKDFNVCCFLDLVDVIGINYYPSIKHIKGHLPTQSEVNSIVTQKIYKDIVVAKEKYPDKEFYISEIGVTKHEDALLEPEGSFGLGTDKRSLIPQIRYVEVAYGILGNLQDIVNGVFWWCADSDKTNNYSFFQNTEAFNKVKSYVRKED